jgi:competence protein ComEC
MIPLAIGVVTGALSLHLFPVLPAWPWTVVTIASLMLVWHRWSRLFGGWLLGFAVAGMYGAEWLERAVPESLAGVEVEVVGTVAGIPVHSAYRSRFLLDVVEIIDGPEAFQARRLRVTRFPLDSNLAPGDRIRVVLRLRPPRGLHNPGSFDYGAWLYREGIHGLASARGEIERLGEETGHWQRTDLHRIRARVRDAMLESHPGARHPGVMQALVIGERTAMEPEDWRRFLHTGTNHLMAISGLHVGLVAGFVLLLARWSWRRVPWLRHTVPLGLFGVLAALTAASVYAALAGFSIPTQRALIMLILVSAAVLWRRDPLSWRIYALAMILVVLLMPANVLAAGFWFSFGAVAVILILLQGRVKRPGATDWLRIQMVLAVALLPLSLAWFQLGSWIAPVANLIAVPVISFLVLPQLLAGAGLALIWTPLGMPLLWWSDLWLALLLVTLEILLLLPAAASEIAVPLAGTVLAMIGVLMVLLPGRRRFLPLAFLACLPLFLPWSPRLAEGDFRAEMLDVGQGLAVVVRTRNHALVYDAGPAWDEGFDSGAAVVLPALRRQGIRHVDRVVVSHEHMDHRGGVGAILAGIPVGDVFSRRGATDPTEEPCESGRHWEWDGVGFAILHPPPYWDYGNAASCVLAVHGRNGRLLLTGDVEGLGERVLVRSVVDAALRTDVLVVPHHGASGVLSRGLLEAASPAVAWVGTGFDNRFGHPAPDVRQRLDANCVALFDTAERGMLWLETDSDGMRLGPGSRVERPRFWHPVVDTSVSLPEHCTVDMNLSRVSTWSSQVTVE